MDALHAARELVPWWVRSGVLSCAVVPFGVAFLVSLLGVGATRVATGVGREAHWTLRARALAPARQVALLAAVFATVVFQTLAGYGENLFVVVPSGVASLAAGMCAWIGAATGAWLPLRGAIDERPGWLASVGGQLLWVLFFFPPLLVLIAMYFAIGTGFSAANVAAGALGIAAYAAACAFAGTPIAWLLGRLRPPPQRVADAVARASARTGIVPRRVWELRMRLANAFAVPIPRWVVVTSRAAEALSNGELEAVAAHELGHLSEPRRVLAARLAAPAALLPFGFGRALYHALGVWGGLALAYAIVLGIGFATRRLQRRMEERADGVARSGEGSPGTYAAALERIYTLNLVPAATGRRAATHPDLYDRLLAAGITPAYPRPAPPSRARFFAGVVAVSMSLVLGALFSAKPSFCLRPLVADAETRTLASIALTGGGRSDLFRLAQARADAGRAAEATQTAALLVALSPQNPEAFALHAWTLTLQGRCAQAAEALSHAVDAHLERGDELSAWVEFAARALGECRERDDPRKASS